MRMFVVSDLSEYALGRSYIRAAERSGIQVRSFDVNASVRTYARLGRLGATLHRFLPVDAWLRKGNRNFVLQCKEFNPDVLVVFGDAPVTSGALAFLRSVTDVKSVLYWPDTLLNLSQSQVVSAPLYDCIATYGKATLPVFDSLSCGSTLWLPFAADSEFLGSPDGYEGPFVHDVSFAGGWRPEREAAASAVRKHFPTLRLGIYGNSWLRSCKDEAVRSCCIKGELIGEQYGSLIRRSRITLNQIDDTNYPSANMRFFEVLASGGLQLSSACPEFEPELRDQEHLLYYHSGSELVEKIQWIMDHPTDAAAIRKNGHAAALQQHTYVDRLKALLAHVSEGRAAAVR